ncbi:MAG: nucleotide-binding protein [Candidatus Thermoplasmatota archaeon]|nr:nucleotide-binding protein [Candidatus Thermoplasmatota archaeon]
MHSNRHCIICGGVIFSGMYCADCRREISRTRTTDDENFEDWLSRTRESRQHICQADDDRIRHLDSFGLYMK